MVPIEFPATVEVSVNDLFSGAMEISGTVRYEEGVLTYTWQTKSLLGSWTERPPIKLPHTDIRAVWVKRGGALLIVQVQRLALMDLIPGDSRDALVLRVRRDSREHARELADAIQRDLEGDTSLRGIPFRLPDINMGMTEVRGLVYLEDNFLVFDVQTSIGGEFWKEQELIKIELTALEEVRFEPGTIRDHLHVRSRTRDLLDAMPGSFQDELRLRIKKRHRDECWTMMEELETLISAH